MIWSLSTEESESEIPGSIPGPAYTFMVIDHEIFSTLILLLLIQDCQLSVAGEKKNTEESAYWFTT